MTCPECGSSKVESEAQHHRHTCLACGCYFADDDYAPQEVLHHGNTFSKPSGSMYDMPECHPDWR
jgi:transcription initiation factor TFIIIB Brf1 subunit/transcription initiation factor TFIIB